MKSFLGFFLIINNVTGTTVKSGLHPRNKIHSQNYDFQLLTAQFPPLKVFVRPAKSGLLSIDFSNAAAVKVLNQALLRCYYQVEWNIPDLCLTPAVPGRADYIHHIRDLIDGPAYQDKLVKGLDIGCGANLIFPVLGHRLYNWSFIATDIDPAALEAAQTLILDRNPVNLPPTALSLRLQKDPTAIFKNILRADDGPIDFSMSNPPFHTSYEESISATQRKWRNLKKSHLNKPVQTGGDKPRKEGPVLNFNGKSNELYCEGGEKVFIQRMISESSAPEISSRIKWFTTLVSKQANIPPLLHALQITRPHDMRVIDMSRGHKQSRILAWTYQK